MDEYDGWWADFDPPDDLESSINAILPLNKSSTADWRDWGDSHSNYVGVYYDDKDKKKIGGMSLKIDARDFSLPFVKGICALANELDLVFVTRSYAVLEPVESIVLDALNQSRAMRYVKDPVATARELGISEEEIARLYEKKRTLRGRLGILWKKWSIRP